MALSVSIELASSLARVTSIKFTKGVSVNQLERTGPIDRTPGRLGSDKKILSSDSKKIVLMNVQVVVVLVLN